VAPAGRRTFASLLLVMATLAVVLSIAVTGNLVSRAQILPIGAHQSPCGTAPNPGWFHTKGVWIEDSQNCRVRLEGVTWYGMQTLFYAPGGLDYQPYTAILSKIKDLGFNTIRIPLTDQLVRYDSQITVTQHLRANPDLKGLHPLQILDRIIQAAGQLGLFVILDNHDTTARTKPIAPGEGPALWTEGSYSELTWIHDWTTLARRYQNNPTVIGFDLRNEPHTNGPGPWSLKTYLKQGATWGRYPSKAWKRRTDWARAARRCGDAVLKVNPHLLIFVEGVQLYPDAKEPRHIDAYWWGSILRGVAHDPVRLDVPHQLVYSTHEWGPWKYRSPQFYGKVTWKRIFHLFNSQWGFILHQADRALRAPIWLGEFNTCNDRKKCVANSKRGSQGQWFQILLRYLKRNPEISWSYYPINGTNSWDQTSNNSILNHHWSKVRLKTLMKALKPIQRQPG